MQSAHQPSPLPPFFDPLSSLNRQQSANIWAPRPVPSDITWPRSLDLSATRFADRDIGHPRPALTVDPLAVNPRASEDVFGPVGFPANARNRGVGAIGDGRKNSVPLHEDRVGSFSHHEADYMLNLPPQHVEQMLRFLNLNSPIPSQTQPLSLLSSTTNSTPDLSPVSATSTLMTPTDLSPATGFDNPKLNCHFDFNQSLPPTQSLLFETSPSRLHAPSLSPTHKSFYAEHGGVRNYNPINLPYADHFSNRASSTYLHQNLGRGADPTRPVITSWNGPHRVGGTDWLRTEDNVQEEAPSVAGTRALSIPPFPTAQSAAHAHEVRICALHQPLPVFYPAPSPSTFSRCYIRPLRLPTISLSRV